MISDFWRTHTCKSSRNGFPKTWIEIKWGKGLTERKKILNKRVEKGEGITDCQRERERERGVGLTEMHALFISSMVNGEKKED